MGEENKLKDPRYAHGPYRYITKHGIGPGTLPKDVNLVKHEDLENFYTAIWTDRFLTSKELKDYDIFPEYIQSVEDIGEGKKLSNKKLTVFESLTDDEIDSLGKYNFSDADLSEILDLLNLIADEDKTSALEIVDHIFNGRELVEVQAEENSDEEIEESCNTTNYVRKLLGDI